MKDSLILSVPLILLVLLHQSLSACAASTAAKALLQLTGAISIDIYYEIQFILQFTSQFQFLANSTANAPLATPIVSLTAQTYVNTTTSQALWGLLNINSLIQSATLTSPTAYLGYYYNATNGTPYVSFTDSETCETYATNSVGMTTGELVSSTPCNPTSWNVYTNVSTVQGHSSYFFTPYLFDPTSSFTENVLLPFSQALNLKGTVITANASLAFLNVLLTKFADDGILLYVMTTSSQGYSLLATSIGESLVSNRKVVSALQAKNEMIKTSAQYWASNSIQFSAGSSGSTGSFSSNGLRYMTSASLFKSYASLNLQWIVVSVMLTGASGSQSQLQNVSYEGLNGNANSKVCEGIASATSILLTDYVSFGLALNFLSGNGENPLRTPVLSVKQTGLTSVTQQTLWGMAGAYKFSYPSASSYYGTYLVDQGSGGYDGYIGDYYYHRILQSAPECPSFKNTYGTTFPTIATDCMRVFPIYSNGQPYQPLAQLQYDPRNTSWYRAMQGAGNQALFYGTTTVPEGLTGTISGVVLVLPVQSQLASGLLGAFEFFIPSTVFSQAISSIKDNSVNVSYIIDDTFYLIASSQQPMTSFVTSNGTRLSALNSSDEVIRTSAAYLKAQSVNTANTFYVYLTPNSFLTVSLLPISTIASVSVNWKVITVSVTVDSSATISAPTASPTAAPTNDYTTIFIIGITFLVVGVLSLGLSGVLMWRVRSQFRAPQPRPIEDAAVRESTASIVEIVNPLPQPEEKL